jgi:hypothetical protein
MGARAAKPEATNYFKEIRMSTLRTVAMVLLVIGILGLFVPGIPGGEFIRYAVILALIVFVVDLFSGRKVA